MRKLTIKRRKKFTGCMMKVKFYLHTNVNPDSVLMGLPCRYLGQLKSGEERTFEIPEGMTSIYAVFDPIFKDAYNTRCDIMPGTEDIYLSGYNKFSPFAGNPFVFDTTN